jgi:hypothetical protein
MNADETESLTCFGGPDLAFKAIQVLQHLGVIADKYVFVPAFGKFICSCREPGGRGQGFAFADLVTVSPKKITQLHNV